MRTWSSSFILQFHKSLPIISINNTILAIINGISKNSVSKLFGNGVLMQLPVFAPGTIHYNRNNIIWVSLTLISSILNLLNSLKTRSALGSTATLVIALASILIVLFILALSFIQRRFKKRGTIRLHKDSIQFIDLESRLHDFHILQDRKTRIHFYMQGNQWLIKMRKNATDESELILAFAPLEEKKKAELKSLLQYWYKNGANIREFDLLGSRMFLMQPNLNFQQIQKIKREYNLVW